MSIEHVVPLEEHGVLDCGHRAVPRELGSGFTLPGYGVDNQGKRHCYACCIELDKEDLKTAQRFFAYLESVKNPQPGEPKWKLTNWTGAPLFKDVEAWETRHNIGGTVYRVRAVDLHGGRWFGMGPGRYGLGNYVRLRRLK